MNPFCNSRLFQTYASFDDIYFYVIVWWNFHFISHYLWGHSQSLNAAKYFINLVSVSLKCSTSIDPPIIKGKQQGVRPNGHLRILLAIYSHTFDLLFVSSTLYSPWKRKWQPTSVFLPGEFHGQRSLEGNSPWSHKELDMTDWLAHSLFHIPLTFKSTSSFVFP